MQIILSLGTSNKSLAHFLKELKNYRVTTLVDVRDIPQSRHFPHFNRKKMSEYVEAHGIRYVWMGETLGNPKQADGARTLEGFRVHQQSTAYQQGFAALLELLRESQNVALVCAEADVTQCHRQFILEDLRQALASQAGVSFC